MGCNKSSSKREVYSSTILPQETRKTSNRQPNCTPKTTGKRTTATTTATKLVEGKKSQTRSMKLKAGSMEDKQNRLNVN